MSWVANHRHHHAKADTAEDVSSPRHGGFWWAHIRWVYQWSGSEVRRWCPDLDRRRYRVWRRLQIPIIALASFAGLAFGWQAFFWVGAIRLVYVLHFQMFVNSLLHMTPDLPEGARDGHDPRLGRHARYVNVPVDDRDRGTCMHVVHPPCGHVSASVAG